MTTYFGLQILLQLYQAMANIKAVATNSQQYWKALSVL